MNYARAFVAAFLATLIFHQGLLGGLYLAGVVPVAPYATAGTWPLGVPQFVSLAFWGGVWGLVLWLLIGGTRGARYWLGALVIGAIGPTAVAMLVVFPLKGVAVSPAKWVLGGLLNGAWGIGTALLIPPLRRLMPGR